MSEIKNLDELTAFLGKHPNPLIVVASTIEDGFVSCIRPVPTICGAEVTCSPNIANTVSRIIRETNRPVEGIV